MPNFKNMRLSEDIMREIAGLIRERVKDPRVNTMATSVVRVELSGDGSHCKVFISSFNGMEDAENAVKGLQSASGMLRREITNKLHIRRCPELHFIPIILSNIRQRSHRCFTIFFLPKITIQKKPITRPNKKVVMFCR